MKFKKAVLDRLRSNSRNMKLQEASSEFIKHSIKSQYSYNFSYMGRPIIQYPQDMVAMQELIWLVKPDLIIETGIAHGGSLIMNASLLALLDYCDAVESNEMIDTKKTKRRVLGIDIDIRDHNRIAIEKHPMSNIIDMIEGSSISKDVIAKVKSLSKEYSKVMLCLDSNHTYAHVLSELVAYSSLVSIGSYCVVFDTIIEDLPAGSFLDRPWDKEDNPKMAVKKFLSEHSNFVIDKNIDNKLLISVAPDGYLKRVE